MERPVLWGQTVRGRRIQPPRFPQYDMGIDPRRTPLAPEYVQPMRTRTFRASQINPITWTSGDTQRFSEEGGQSGDTTVNARNPIGKPRFVTLQVPDVHVREPRTREKVMRPTSTPLLAMQMRGPYQHEVSDYPTLVQWFLNTFGVP